MAHIRRISTQTNVDIGAGWNVSLTAAGALSHPSELAQIPDAPLTGKAPGTVASALRSAGRDPLERGALDDLDAWYTCHFEAEVPSASDKARLVFDGLATIADVWLNGEPLLHSENMFLRHKVDVTSLLQERNELCLRFSALNRFLELQRPRGRWRTKLVDHSQLRWARTSLLGHFPRWNQPIHAVGPWRPISLDINRILQVEAADIRAGVEREAGIVQARVEVQALAGEIAAAFLHVGAYSAKLQVKQGADGRFWLQGDLKIPHVDLWWPHTHGAQPLYPVKVLVTVGERTVEVDFGCTGFRILSFDREGGNFAVTVNGERVFLRGACWMPVDVTRLTVDDSEYARPLTLAREAGMNLLRVPGESFYESEAFYDRCAALGIALWQDFAFALMDYPAQDAGFCASVAAEAAQLLDRLQLNPALAVVCGNSDVELQAAMLGLEAEQWKSPLFYELLPHTTQQARSDVAYVPSSPTGGALPFHVDTGIAQYYGIGTYLRPLDDARRSGVRFATECLAFGNIPEDETVDSYLADGEAPGPYPSWRAGVPREVGVGLDFDDIRDHYARLLFGEEPDRARRYEPQHYLALGRVTVGEVMAATFSEWRRPVSSCNGALVWFYRDLSPGAGWGIIDVYGRPKSAYYYLKRALASPGLFFVDEGLNGLRLHIVNERPSDLDAELEITLYRHGHVRIHHQSVPVHVAGRGASELRVDELIGHFMDTTYAYRFGPPTHDVTVAALRSGPQGAMWARAFHFPAGLQFARSADLGLVAQARPCGDGAYALTVRAERFAQAVSIDAHGFHADDNYFHLEPGAEHRVVLIPEEPRSRELTGHVTALNALAPTKIRVLPRGPSSEAI